MIKQIRHCKKCKSPLSKDAKREGLLLFLYVKRTENITTILKIVGGINMAKKEKKQPDTE